MCQLNEHQISITSDSAAWNSKNCGHAKLAKKYRMGCNCKAQSQWD